MTTERSKERKSESERRRTTDQVEQTSEAPAHPLLQLQRQVGNRQVARMLAQRQAAVQRESEEDVQRTNDHTTLQRKPDDMPEVGAEGGPISSGLAQRIQSQRGGGSPLPDTTRTQMEGSFGTSFEHVRLHTGSESASLNRQVGAKAFTTGSDIFFGKDASPGDKGLLGHELTHVVQQSSMRASGPMTVSKDGDAHEVEANRMSSSVTSGVTQRTIDDDV